MAEPGPSRRPNPDEALAALARSGGSREGATCPSCGADRLSVIDASARPHALWYVFRCSACGLDRTLNLPLGALGAGDA